MIATMQCQFQESLRDQRWIAREGFKRQKILVNSMSLNMDSSDDILYEVMKHLDAKSLSVAACVSRKWKTVADDASLWENLCIQHWPSPVPRRNQLRSVVMALGGFRRLYVLCLRPLLARGQRAPQPVPSSCAGQENGEHEWSKDEVHLSLSLFSIDCYERLGRRHLNSSSLKLLCKPVASLALAKHRMISQIEKAESNVR